jgi:hypothetical protein
MPRRRAQNAKGAFVMRTVAITVLVAIRACAACETARAQSTCKVCADLQKARMKNYAGPTCRSEYQICVKSCKE